MSGRIITHQCHDVLHVTIDDPSSANALDLVMVEQLREALERAEHEARAVLLTGNQGFCSGANILAGAGFDLESSDLAAPLVTHFDPLIAQIRQLSIPVVAAVRGAAAGYGAALALVCDVILASDSAFFQQSFVRLGLVPDGGSAFILLQAIGRVRAMRMMMLGQRLGAAEALDWGLITEVVPDADLDRRAEEIAQALASGPTVALGAIRRMGWEACSGDLDDALALETALQRRVLATEDHRKAREAFLNKQAPTFNGR